MVTTRSKSVADKDVPTRARSSTAPSSKRTTRPVDTIDNDPKGFLWGLFGLLSRDFLIAIALIFGGCCSNVVYLEFLIKEHSKSGMLITFFQFIIVTIEGLISNLERSTSNNSFLPIQLHPRVIPLSRWFVMVSLFFTASVLNNVALGYQIPMPFHIIFRSGGLIVSMVLGVVVLKKRYSIREVVGVVMVTLGVVISTLSSAKTSASTATSTPLLNSKNANLFSLLPAGMGNVPDFFVGVACLLVALVLSSFLGLYQQITYEKYGKQWREGLFYTHFLALPYFLFFANSILSQITEYNNSPLISIIPRFANNHISTIANFLPTTLLHLQIPRAWVFLIMNVLTQYVCISGVHKLSSLTSSLSLNLVLSIRKFLSLVFSVLYFRNYWSELHLVGAAALFLGTLLYSLGTSYKSGSSKSKSKSKKKQS